MADRLDFDAFYLSSRDRLALQVAGFTGDAAEALDHVQEAFIQAWARWDKVSGYDDPEAWVRRVACNRAVSRWRRARRVVLRATQDEQLHLDPEQHAVIEALALLGPREREAIVLHHLVGYSVEEVAEQLRVPSGTVKSWLSRGRARLAELLRAQQAVGHEQ
ncbi:MAG: RNA polymerase sigma factor [Jatrophihabitantaceae bacterium]